jgi:hypothetical protein
MERVSHRRLFYLSLVFATLSTMACPDGVFAKEREATILAKPPSDSEWEQRWQERRREQGQQEQRQQEQRQQEQRQQEREQSWGHAVGIIYVLPTLISLLIFALTGLLIGQQMGRPTAGFLWGLLAGPLGWLIVAVGPNRQPKCPYCGGVVVLGASKCKNCCSSLTQAL